MLVLEGQVVCVCACVRACVRVCVCVCVFIYFIFLCLDQHIHNNTTYNTRNITPEKK